MWDADVSNIGFNQGNGIAALYDTTINSSRKMNMRKLKAQSERQQKTGVTDVAANKATENKTDAADDKATYADGTKEEVAWDADLRQALFENLTTQDDHLMHITGLEKSKNGKNFL